jgi:hypothetical protein
MTNFKSQPQNVGGTVVIWKDVFTPIESGIRKSLVIWVSGLPFR